MPKYPKEIEYSETVNDELYSYRNVRLPEAIFKKIPSSQRGKIMSDDQWRALGIKSSKGWQHYCVYKPESNIILLRKPLNYPL